MKRTLKNNRGSTFIWFMIIILAFAGISSVLIDFGNIYLKSKKIKYAVNRSVKAGTMPIQKGENLANGIFLIEPTNGKDNFKVILAHNLGLDETTLEPLSNGRSLLTKAPVIKELEVINTTSTTYNSPTLGRSYPISKPTIIAVLEFEVKGMFIKKTLKINKLSSSQLTSIYD